MLIEQPRLNARRPLRGVLFLSLTAWLLAACTAAPDAGSSRHEGITLLVDFDLSRRIYSSQVEPCGEPVAWRDVRVLWADGSNDPGQQAADGAAADMPRSGEWVAYWFTGSHVQATRKAQRAFAAKGCDLLLIGGIRSLSRRSTSGTNTSAQIPATGGSTDVLLIRWGRNHSPE